MLPPSQMVFFESKSTAYVSANKHISWIPGFVQYHCAFAGKLCLKMKYFRQFRVANPGSFSSSDSSLKIRFLSFLSFLAWDEYLACQKTFYIYLWSSMLFWGHIFRWGPTGQLDTICNVKTQVVMIVMVIVVMLMVILAMVVWVINDHGGQHAPQYGYVKCNRNSFYWYLMDIYATLQ